MILVGLVGGNFTLTGSYMPGVGMPKVGNWVRLPCFSVGSLLVLVAIVLGYGNLNSANPSPVTGSPPSPVTTPPSIQSSTELAPGVVMAPQGDTTLYVFAQPSVSSSVVAEIASGTTIGIRCTTQGDVVTNADTGQSSSLWDGTSEGYVPDVYVDTGSNQATMGSC